MQKLVENAHDIPLLLPTWKPSAENIFAEHISKLCIPTIGTGLPSLLLHGLGEDNQYGLGEDSRIKDVFSIISHMCVT